MYRHIEAPTTLESVLFSAAGGMICGGVFAFCLAPISFFVLFGGTLGLIGGLAISPVIVVVLRDGTLGHAGWFAFLPALVLSIIVGAIGINPLIAMLLVISVFTGLCAISAQIAPASRPIDPFTCENCGYDLHGITDINCPECGRERIVMPKQRPAPTVPDAQHENVQPPCPPG